MAEQEYNQMPVVSSLEEDDQFRLQRRVGSVWRDYKLDVMGNTGFFISEFDVATLIGTPNQVLGPAAPTGYGYSILPWSSASYEPGPGHVDGTIKILFYDATASDVVRETTFLLRQGDIVYNTIASAISNVDNDLSEQYQLNMNAPFLAGDGTLRVCIYYTLIPI